MILRKAAQPELKYSYNRPTQKKKFINKKSQEALWTLRIKISFPIIVMHRHDSRCELAACSKHLPFLCLSSTRRLFLFATLMLYLLVV